MSKLVGHTKNCPAYISIKIDGQQKYQEMFASRQHALISFMYLGTLQLKTPYVSF